MDSADVVEVSEVEHLMEMLFGLGCGSGLAIN
jgi:hypothetical protein